MSEPRFELGISDPIANHITTRPQSIYWNWGKHFGMFLISNMIYLYELIQPMPGRNRVNCILMPAAWDLWRGQNSLIWIRFKFKIFACIETWRIKQKQNRFDYTYHNLSQIFSTSMRLTRLAMKSKYLAREFWHYAVFCPPMPTTIPGKVVEGLGIL